MNIDTKKECAIFNEVISVLILYLKIIIVNYQLGCNLTSWKAITRWYQGNIHILWKRSM